MFQTSFLAPPAKMRKGDSCTESTPSSCSEDSLPGEKGIVWPMFHNNGKNYPTQFEAGRWKCPICSDSALRIQQHLAKHLDLIQDWAGVQKYCKEIVVVKLKEKDRKQELKRANDPRRRESKGRPA